MYHIQSNSMNLTTFNQQGHALIDALTQYFNHSFFSENADISETFEANSPIAVAESPQEMLEYWQRDFESVKDQPASFDEIIPHFKDLMQKSIQTQSPRFIGHQVTNPLPINVLTDAVLAALNGSIAIYEMGAAGLALEKLVADYFIEKFGWDEDANAIFVSGGSLGNLTALLAARQAKAGYDAWTQGNSNNLAVMVSDEAHYCVSRAVQMMGFGSHGVIKIPTDDRLKIIPEQLETVYQNAMANGKTVIAVVGNACSTSTGTYDDLSAIADFCQQHDLWFHIDGAHGAPVVLSEQYKHLMKGAEQADSIVLDFHKMLLTPALTTLTLFRDGTANAQTFAQKADYLLTASSDWHQGANRTIECTRPMMSVRAYTVLKFYGAKFLGDYVTRMYDLGQHFATMIEERPHFELAVPPDGNIICFRYVTNELQEQQQQDEHAINRFNLALRQKLLQDGQFYIVQTIVNGQAYLRTTIINRFTTQEHLQQLLDRLEKLAK